MHGLQSVRTAAPPYVTDTKYVTPPPLCWEEHMLREAILRWDLGLVDDMLRRLRSEACGVWISGGVIDAAIIAGRTIARCVEAEGRTVTPLSAAPMCPLPQPAVNPLGSGRPHPSLEPLCATTSQAQPSHGLTRRTSSSPGVVTVLPVKRWNSDPSVSGTSSDDDSNNNLGGPCGANATSGHLSRLSGSSALMTALPPRSPLMPASHAPNSSVKSAGSGSGVSPSRFQVISTSPFIGVSTGGLGSSSRKRRQNSAIMVPASSLPTGPPSALLDSCDTEGSSDDDDGDADGGLLGDPFRRAANSHGSLRGLVSPLLTATANDGDQGMRSSPDDAAIAELVRRLLGYPFLDARYCGPVSIAVREDNLACVRLLLRDGRFDPNTGCPLRVAVLLDRIQCFEELIRCPRVNPNRGAPLLYAVRKCNLWAVRWLCDHPATQVNRYATGTSTTPLLCAIRLYCDAMHGDGVLVGLPSGERGGDVAQSALGDCSASAADTASACITIGAAVSPPPSHVFEMIRVLVLNPRVDLNKGFAETPLQIAVSHSLTDLTRLLLSRPSIAPNRSIGLHPSPLQIAVENEDLELVEVLLTDPRTYITEDLVNRLERENHLPLLQVIANHSQDGLRMGFAWSMRCLVVVVLALVLWLGAILDFTFVLSLSASGATMPSVFLLVAQISGCVATTWILLRRRVSYTGIPWYASVVPFAPVPESIMAAKLAKWLMADVYDLYSRQRNFELFCSVSRMRGAAWVAPSLLAHLVLFLSPASSRFAHHSNTTTNAACILFLLVAIALCVGLRRLRLPNCGGGSTRPSAPSGSAVISVASEQMGPVPSTNTVGVPRRNSLICHKRTVPLPRLPVCGLLATASCPNDLPRALRHLETGGREGSSSSPLDT